MRKKDNKKSEKKSQDLDLDRKIEEEKLNHLALQNLKKIRAKKQREIFLIIKLAMEEEQKKEIHHLNLVLVLKAKVIHHQL